MNLHLSYQFAPKLFCNSGRKAAFTLPQLIAVLSVMAILASVTIPVASKRIDEAARNGEAANLAVMSEALEQSLMGARTIPASTGFAQQIATYLNVPTSDVQNNKRGYTRTFLFDPNFSLVLPTATLTAPPYSQTRTGAVSMPTGTRALIISSVAKALPTIVATNFDNIWTTAKGAVPTSMSGWGGRGEDLIVERIELGPRFHKILLMNVDVAPAIGFYSIDNATNSLAAGARFAAYFMDGTVLSVLKTDGATIDFRETVTEDVSLVYQNGKWGRQLSSTDDSSGTFGQLVDRFLQQPVPCDPQNGATQRSVVNAFYDYLWGYADWAFGDPTAVPAIPPFAGAGGSSTPQYPSYSVVYDAQNHMSGNTASFTQNLID